MSDTFLEAVYFYYGILEAYEVVGQELIGPDVLNEHAIPRMVYYVRQFLPKEFREKSDENLKEELGGFLSDLKQRVDEQQKVTIQEIWQLRAAIFGYESAFLEVLGDNVIKNYVLKRLPEILAVYLPEVFSSEEISLEAKLDGFSEFLVEQKFAKFANWSIKENEVTFNVNKCAFADIHNSDAYLDKKTRFCPWGMMALAIVNAHEGKEFPIGSSSFATRGTITVFEMID